MSIVEYVFIFTFLGSVVSLVGGFALLAKESLAHRISHILTTFAAGTFLATVFFDLLPEAAEAAEGTGTDIFLWTLVGIIVFFYLGRMLHWFHHHDDHEDPHAKRRAETPLIIIGDTIHNFIDGIVIASTFLVSIPLGIVTTFAVAAHEIPQEIGDFGLLLHRGISRRNVLIINIISALFAFLGAILALTIGESIKGLLPIFLALTAGFFLYISLSDIVPGINHETRRGHILFSSIVFFIGIAVVGVAITLLEGGH
ncbi:MAG: ZIP family metal transporter [bacterium]|nr:ZIP family metal transporter [bacterium]